MVTTDELDFVEDSFYKPQKSWTLLVVDDDEDMHLATESALQGVEMLGRTPRFLHAHSARECLSILSKDSDIAVILLDVVMESEDAGLRLVAQIRTDMGLILPRIVLRTGQPGYAPELDAIRDYDINDYKTKGELTRSKLFTTVLAAIRAYDQLQRTEANRHGLEQIVKASSELLNQAGLNSLSSGIIRQLAALIGVEADGLLCAQAKLDKDTDKDDHIVLAASGRLEAMMGRPLDEIDDARIVTGIKKCLELQANIFEDDHLVLHFSMHSIRSFAVFVDSSTIPDEVDRSLLQVFCNNVSMCAENIQLVNRLKDFAYFDRLVDLPNRTAFVQTVDQKLDGGETDGLCVVLADIDQFAEINNAFGHEYGDQLLKKMADRLKTHLGESCTIARLSGDAFGILGKQTELLPAKLRQIFAEPYKINELEHSVAASTGIVRLADSGPDGLSVLKDASIARKLAREKGINNDVYYYPYIGFQAKERTHLMQHLHGAFEHNRLFAAYQPQVDLQDGSLIGFEVLMRWRDDNGVFVAPDAFIPLAEKSGLIISMGTWILRSSLYTLAELKQAGWNNLRMAVNVSTVQFRTPDFVETVKKALLDTGVEPEWLELEITESVAMDGQHSVEDKLSQIRELGVEIAIDDFGTGFSSLSYLERLPLNRIKIDRSFVKSMDSEEGNGKRITDLVIKLGQSLGLRVIAEGVEHESQVAMLLELGCHEAQGYFYGKPMHIDDLRIWLKSRYSKSTADLAL